MVVLILLTREQKGHITCPRPHSLEASELGFELKPDCHQVPISPFCFFA